MPERFFTLALAYLDSTITLFRHLADAQLPQTFSHAQAAGFMLEHSAELFLKGALILAGRNPGTHHDADNLYRQFKNLYPGKQFDFEARIHKLVQKDESLPQEQFTRYPVDNQGNVWLKNVHFNLPVWLKESETLRSDFERLIPRLKDEKKANALNRTSESRARLPESG